MPFAQLGSGLRMYYMIDDFTDPWTTPEVALLHHGMAKNSSLFYRWVPVLARHYRVVRLDARGFGRSAVPPPGFRWSIEQFARDILALLDRLGLQKVHYVGESVGGTFGFQFAYQYPERLNSLTICGSPYRFAGQPNFLNMANQVEAEGTLAWAKASMGNRAGNNPDPRYVDWYANQMGKTKPHVVIGALRALSSVDLTSALPKIKVPTLFLITDARQEQGQTMAPPQSLIPNSRVVVIKGATGFVQHTAPERCAEECIKFWRDLS